MSRTLNDIQDVQLNAINTVVDLNASEVLTENEQTNLNVLSTSKVARWRQMLWSSAFGIWVLEQLFDIHIKDIEQRLSEGQIHTRPWYRRKALDFRYGQDLITDTDTYSDDGLTLQQINASKIIKHAAVIRVVANGAGALRVKCAKEEGGVRLKLNENELSALYYYMNEITDGGTQVSVTSIDADNLKLEWLVYYDPLVLDEEGKRRDGTNDTPLIEACQSFLKETAFNGEFISNSIERFVEQVEGVKIPILKKAWSSYADYDYDTENVLNVGLIEGIRVAEAGWMSLDLDAIQITYIPKND